MSLQKKDQWLPPEIPQPNIYPVEWRVDTPKLVEIYELAKKDYWNPSDLPWDEYKPENFTEEQKVAVAYWFGVLANFEFSGPAVFAKAMIEAYQLHEEDPIRKLFGSIVRDEMNHEEICYRCSNLLLPGWPADREPESELEKLALRNLNWIYHNGGRYWEGYNEAYDKYSFAILFTSFMMGEVAATTLFANMGKNAVNPVFKQMFKNIALDESRHTAFTLELAKQSMPTMSPEEKKMITKQIRAGFIFLSLVLYEPPETDFWELPDDFLEIHRRLDSIAMTAGMGLQTMEQRREIWRTSLLRVKGIVEPFGIEFPAIPEVGLEGVETPLDPNDLVIPFL